MAETFFTPTVILWLLLAVFVAVIIYKINTNKKAKARIQVWWKFKTPLLFAILGGFIIAIFSLTDINLASVVAQEAPPVVHSIGSTVSSMGSSIPFLDNLADSSFGWIFYAVFIGVSLLLWVLFSGIIVLFGSQRVK